MKKIVVLLMPLLIVLSALFIGPSKTKASEIDQNVNCSANEAGLYENVQITGEYSQTFYPSFNRIDQISVKVGGAPTGFSGVASWRILGPTGTELATGTRNYEGINEETYWYINTFPPTYQILTVTPGQQYKFILQTTTDLYWYKSSNCGMQGNAVADGYTLGIDFDFTAWGLNVAEQGTTESPSTPATTTTTTTTTTPTATGMAPAAQTDSSIKPATALKAENVAGANPPTVKLTWTKSTTTDITGYKIFRSLEEKKGFTEISKVDKAVVEYLDATVAASTKYYYFVRAYRATAESASTSTVNLTTEAAPAAATTEAPAATTTTAAPATTLPLSSENSINWLLVILIVLFILLASTLLYFEYRAKKGHQKLSPKILWPLVSLMIICAGLIIWQLIPEKKKTEATTELAKTAATAPKHADWPVFTSSKYGFKLYHPADYTVTEGTDGKLTIAKGATTIADVFSMDAGGDEAGMIRSSAALYTDASKGYMTGAVESSVTAAGQSAKKYTGTFGKNGGAKTTVYDGIKGSAVMFTKNNRLWTIDSFDNEDAAAITIFNDMISDMSF